MAVIKTIKTALLKQFKKHKISLGIFINLLTFAIPITLAFLAKDWLLFKFTYLPQDFDPKASSLEIPVYVEWILGFILITVFSSLGLTRIPEGHVGTLRILKKPMRIKLDEGLYWLPRKIMDHVDIDTSSKPFEIWIEKTTFDQIPLGVKIGLNYYIQDVYRYRGMKHEEIERQIRMRLEGALANYLRTPDMDHQKMVGISDFHTNEDFTGRIKDKAFGSDKDKIVSDTFLWEGLVISSFAVLETTIKEPDLARAYRQKIIQPIELKNKAKQQKHDLNYQKDYIQNVGGGIKDLMSELNIGLGEIGHMKDEWEFDQSAFYRSILKNDKTKIKAFEKLMSLLSYE